MKNTIFGTDWNTSTGLSFSRGFDFFSLGLLCFLFSGLTSFPFCRAVCLTIGGRRDGFLLNRKFRNFFGLMLSSRLFQVLYSFTRKSACRKKETRKKEINRERIEFPRNSEDDDVEAVSFRKFPYVSPRLRRRCVLFRTLLCHRASRRWSRV